MSITPDVQNRDVSAQSHVARALLLPEETLVVSAEELPYGHQLVRDHRARPGSRSCVFVDAGAAALNVSPHDAHRHNVSFVIAFASVPTLVDPQDEHTGRVGN